MNVAFFSKISKTMSWSELEQKILEQKRKNTIPLPFTIIEKINISSIDFDILSTVISEPNILYAHYSDSSVATSQGIWNCILKLVIISKPFTLSCFKIIEITPTSVVNIYANKKVAYV